jgi:hypothetical protein
MAIQLVQPLANEPLLRFYHDDLLHFLHVDSNEFLVAKWRLTSALIRLALIVQALTRAVMVPASFLAQYKIASFFLF